MNEDNLTFPIIVIPAFNPGAELPDLINALLCKKNCRIVVVNDGSAVTKFFTDLQHRPQVTLLRHRRNEGKGAALKSAFNHIINHFPETCGAVTADADGQHLPEDIIMIGESLVSSRNIFLLGTRDFHQAVPWRSKLGNCLARLLFRLTTRLPLYDTQTGLRGIPAALLPRLSNLPGRRYEYELAMLFTATASCPMQEIPIRTVYRKKNTGSHFKPIRDSLKMVPVFCAFRKWKSGQT